MKYIKFLFIGALFGTILLKSEVVSWFRIQEMFRFDSFHMYGVIGSAVVVGAGSFWALSETGKIAQAASNRQRIDMFLCLATTQVPLVLF